MQNLKIHLQASGYLKISQTSSRLVRHKSLGDKATDREKERRGRIQAQIERARSLLRFLSPPSITEGSYTSKGDGVLQLGHLSSPEYNRTTEYQAEVCHLPPVISLYDDELQKWERPIPLWQWVRQNITYPLDLLKKFQEAARPKPGWGKVPSARQFSAAAKRSILNLGGAFDKEWGATGCRELTLTLPGSTSEAIEALSRWSGWLSNRMMQILRDFNDRREAIALPPVAAFYIWEFQKRGALHQHWCLGGEDPIALHQIALSLKEEWFRLLHEIGELEALRATADEKGPAARFLYLEAQEKYSLFRRRHGGSWEDKPEKWQWHSEPLKVNVAGYFAKYASKGCGKKSEEGKWLLPPARFWGANKLARNTVARYTISYTLGSASKELFGEVLEWLTQYNRYTRELGLRLSRFTIVKGGVLIAGVEQVAGFIPKRLHLAIQGWLSLCIDAIREEYREQMWGLVEPTPRFIKKLYSYASPFPP